MMKLLLICLLLAVAVDAAPCNDNQYCDSCDLNGRCLTKCDRGFYGYHCEYNCSLGCKNDVCHSEDNIIDVCTQGCKLGFYGTRCTIPCKKHANICRKCPKECESGFCQLRESCSRECQDSYYGTDCKSCPAWCKVCNRVSGTCEVCLHCEGNCSNGCLDRCKPGYFGNFCEQTCTAGCLSGCNQTSGDCLCPHNCMDGKCDDDGNCTLGCKKGWFGQTCRAQCSNRCLAKDCDQVGVCTQGCKDCWYGPQCKYKCATGCRGDICARNGNCVYGCKVGFYGIKCENRCSASCLNKVCDDKDGTCKSCMKGFYGSHCNKSCVGCEESSCHDACNAQYEGVLTSNYIPYIVAAVLVVIVSALVTYAACRFKRLQSVIYGSRRGQRHNFQPQTDPTEEAAEPTVNFYCELDEDTTSPPQLPSRCGTKNTASPLTMSRNQHGRISNSQESVFPTQAEQHDDTSDDREEATPNSPESDSPRQTEHNSESVHTDELFVDVCVPVDFVLHEASRPNSYLTAFAEEVNGIEGIQVDVITEQVRATRVDTRPPEMVDMRSLTRPQKDFLSVPSVYTQVPVCDTGPPRVTKEHQNDFDDVANFPVKARGFDKVPSLSDEPQGEGYTGSDRYARATDVTLNTSHITAQSSEDDNKLPTISIPVIADCYDNFSVDDEGEAIPNPPPDNYSNLFTTNYQEIE